MKASIIAVAVAIISSGLSLLAADYPGVEALARDYLTAVQNRDAVAVRALFLPPATFAKSEKERQHVESQWIQASVAPGSKLPVPESARIEVTRFEDSTLKVHAPWRWPLQPNTNVA